MAIIGRRKWRLHAKNRALFCLSLGEAFLPRDEREALAQLEQEGVVSRSISPKLPRQITCTTASQAPCLAKDDHLLSFADELTHERNNPVLRRILPVLARDDGSCDFFLAGGVHVTKAAVGKKYSLVQGHWPFSPP